MTKYLYQPFDGGKIIFSNLAEACRQLDVNYGTVSNHFRKSPDRPYIFRLGKIEKTEVR